MSCNTINYNSINSTSIHRYKKRRRTSLPRMHIIIVMTIYIICSSAEEVIIPKIRPIETKLGTSSAISVEKSIGGSIILDNDKSKPLYYNAKNESQELLTNEELYYNAKESLSQGRRLRGMETTPSPVTTDIIGKIETIKSEVKQPEKFLKYEKPLKIEPYNVKLSNGRWLPLVGIGAGNIPRQKIPLMINEAMYSVRLVDTSKAQSNESLVARAVLRWLKAQPKVKEFDANQHVIHVIAKVWYTHLGYERTSLSVRESLSDLSSILISSKNIGYQVKVHAILQYPRCYDEIEWMRCQEEEMQLDAHTRSVGPDPNLDPDNAFKGSWKALEEMYNANLLESIGVSNFKLKDMKDLLDMCTIKPHLFQGNLFNVIYDAELMDLLKLNNIFFQTYNIMRDTYGRKSSAPRAFAALQRIGLNYAVNDMSGGFSGAQVLSSWLLTRGYGIIPGSSQQSHLIENLPQFIRKIPKLADLHDIDVHTSLNSLLKGIDASEYHFSGIDASKGVVVTFYNAFSGAVKIFAIKNGRQIAASVWMETGKSNRVIAATKDVFVAYDVHGAAIKRFRIEQGDGLEETLTVQV